MRHKALFLILIFSLLSIQVIDVYSWGKGGFRADPSNHLETTEHHINVPYWSQPNDYYCGPASLQMVFDYYGEAISQTEIAEVAHTISPGTYTIGLARAAYFSNQSTSSGTGTEMPHHITGYTKRSLGYAESEIYGLTVDQLKEIVENDYPVIVLMLTVPGGFGHFRVVTGYDETYIYTNDPWKYGGGFGGLNYRLTYSEFDQLWDYSGHWGMVAFPWFITLNVPAQINLETEFTVTANITYPRAPTFPTSSPASACKATITFPAGVTLADGETQTKALPDIYPGMNTELSWTLRANEYGNFKITVEAEGNVTGFDPQAPPPQEYTDRIGGTTSSSMIALGPEGHNIEIAKLELSKKAIVKSMSEETAVHINVTAKNRSNYLETFNLTIRSDSGEIRSETVTLEPWSDLTIQCTFDVADLTYGKYNITAEASLVSYETNTTDNELTIQFVITIFGDLSGDGIVDIFDVVKVARIYGTSQGDSNYEPTIDLIADGRLDRSDLEILRMQFGKMIP